MARKSDSSQRIDQFIGGRIRYFRLKQELSQQELAQKLDISYQQLHKYENGSNSVSASRLSEIAGHLGVLPSDFFMGIHEAIEDDALSPPSAFNREQMELLMYLNRISEPAKRQTLASLLHSLAGKNTV